jgi:hypothetical protein
MRLKLAMLFLLVTVAVAAAQGHTKRMWVYAIDQQTYRAIPGAFVTVADDDVSFSGVTDRHGRVIFDVPLGTYDFTVSAEASGYYPDSRTDTVIVAKKGGPPQTWVELVPIE